MSAQATSAVDLRGLVLRGLAWKAAASVCLQLSRFVAAVVIARLLTPHEYGVAGMVLVFASLVLLFGDLAFGSALVQRRDLTEADRSTVFWTSVGAGVALTGAGIALAGPISSFYGEPEVRPLFAAFSVAFVVGAVASTHTALLTREMDFRRLELRQIAAGLAAAVTGIALAAGGYGPWAIIGQQLVAVSVSSALLWVSSPWRPRFTYSLASLRSLGGYSANVLGSRLLFYGNRNADNLIVGRFLGAASLGAYQIAYNLMLVPISQLAGPVQDVLFPALARMQDDRRALVAAWLRSVRLMAAVSVPAMAGLMACAPDFVVVVLGDKWRPAIPAIQILAWVGLLQSLQGMNSAVLRAVDRTRELLRYSVIVFAASLAAFVAGLPWGVVGVATAYAVSSSIVEPYYSWLTARAAGITLAAFARNVAGVVAAAGGMVAVILAARLTMADLGLAAPARLPAEVLIGAVVYALLCARTAPEVTGDIGRAWARMRTR